ncbi:E3 ubiquitin-protein ligase [Canna indica]|uniref:E3 ubiquitin-protein ligase n=1 Tax=Canna indica TaxID=4628 RepID=A0AAQ3JU09_9LILI|nr:E3 ubiquitin-protein ligase [Canna indica]
MAMLTKFAKINNEWTKTMTDQDADNVLKSLLEVLSDDISISTKLSLLSLDMLLEIVAASKKNRLKAIEVGAVCVLVKLLPKANRHSCEKVLLLLNSELVIAGRAARDRGGVEEESAEGDRSWCGTRAGGAATRGEPAQLREAAAAVEAAVRASGRAAGTGGARDERGDSVEEDAARVGSGNQVGC